MVVGIHHLCNRVFVTDGSHLETNKSLNPGGRPAGHYTRTARCRPVEPRTGQDPRSEGHAHPRKQETDEYPSPSTTLIYFAVDLTERESFRRERRSQESTVRADPQVPQTGSRIPSSGERTRRAGRRLQGIRSPMLERNIFCCGVILAIVCLNVASGAAIQSAFQATGSNETDVTLEGTKDSCVNRCNQRGVDHRYPCQCCTACTKYNDCCADYTDVCHAKPGISNQELLDWSRDMHDNDINGVADIILSLQSKTKAGDSSDKAPASLFGNLPADVFTGPTVKALIALHDNYEAQVSHRETITDQERAEEDAFLDAIMGTYVMKSAHQFLADRGMVDTDAEKFKKYLHTIWFGMYSRASGVVGSSGFEHVFVGEMKNGISGLHSWVRYALLEQTGSINYLGYINDVLLGVSSMLEMPMKWNGVYKPISSIAVAGSPELEIALGTVCFLARPNSLCPLHGSNNNQYHYQTYTLPYKGVTYVGSAYPTV